MKLRDFNGAVGKSVQDPNTRALVVEELVAAAPILQHVEFYEHKGSSVDKPTKNASINSGVSSRAIGSDYTAVVGAPDFGEIELKTFGGTLRTDKGYERMQAGGTASEHLRQVREFARGAGRKFTDVLFNGNSATLATEFDGLANIVPAGQILKFDSDNGGSVPFGTTTANIAQQKKFLEYLDRLIGMVTGGPNILAMDSKTLSRLRTIGRDFIQTMTIMDAFGTNQALSSYNGLPIITTGFKLNNTGSVIGFDEICGTAENTTSD
jgi:hypothetical protein